jgi:hypothetical protein
MAFHDFSDGTQGHWRLAAGVLSQTAPLIYASALPRSEPILRDLVAGDDVPIGCFNTLEWKVIALARRESLASLDVQVRRPGVWSRVAGWLFGGAPRRPLANARLEALRSLAVDSWHHGSTVSLDSLHGFRAAGFDAAQLDLLLESSVLARIAGEAAAERAA